MNQKETVYIAYSGGGSSEELSRELFNKLSVYFNVVHYGNRVENGEQYDIENLMKEIGDGKYVVIVIDDKYLTESIYCAEEIRYMMNNSSKLEGRLFPIFSIDFEYNHNDGETRKLKQKARKLIDDYESKNFNIQPNDDDKLEVEKRCTQILDCKRTTDIFIDIVKWGSGLSYKSDEIDKLVKDIQNNLTCKNTLNLNPINFKQKEAKYKDITGRLWVAEKVENLIKENANKSIFWLAADAGYGKSAIATYLYKNNDNAGGIFYIEYENPESKKVRRLLETMIFQFRERYDWYRKEIPKSIKDNISNYDLFIQFIYDPFVQNIDKNCWYIIDGIDESYIEEENEQKSELIHFIRDRFEKLPKNLKVIILGREDTRFKSKIINKSALLRLDDNSFTKENLEDSKRFIDVNWKKENSNKNRDNAINHLLHVSKGNMQYLTKFFEAVENGIIDDMYNTDQFPPNLGDMYQLYFDRLDGGIKKYSEQYVLLLELLIVYKEPMPRLLIQKILKINLLDMDNIIKAFTTLIIEENARITFYDYSLREWLQSEEDKGDYNLDLSRGTLSLNTFIAEMDQDSYQDEYIDFPFFNKLIVDYYLPDKYGDISDFYKIIQKNNLSKIVDLVFNLIDNYVNTKDNYKAIMLIDELVSDARIAFDEKTISIKSYSSFLLKQAKIYDMLHEYSMLIKEALLELLEKNYEGDDELSQHYVDILVMVAYELDQTDEDGQKQALAYKKRANQVIDGIYAKDPKKWYGLYIKVLRSLAYSYDGNYNLKKGYDKKSMALEILEQYGNENSEEYNFHAIGILNDLSFSSQKIADKTNDITTKEKLYKNAIAYGRTAYNDCEEHFHENTILWLEYFQKTSLTLSNALFKYYQISEKESLIKEASGLIEKSKNVIEKYYIEAPERWSTLYAKVLSSMAYVYSDYIIDYDKFEFFSEQAKTIFQGLYDRNPNKFITSYIDFLGRLRGKYSTVFNNEEKRKNTENTIENLIIDEVGKGFDIWAYSYLRYLDYNFSHNNQGLYNQKHIEALKKLKNINAQKWAFLWYKAYYGKNSIRFIDEYGILNNDLINLIKEVELSINKYAFELATTLKNINNINSREEKLRFISFAEDKHNDMSRYGEISEYTNRVYMIYLNNLGRMYLSMKPPELSKYKQFEAVIDKSMSQNEDKNTELFKIYLKNKKRAEELDDGSQVEETAIVKKIITDSIKTEGNRTIKEIADSYDISVDNAIEFAKDSPVKLQADLNGDTILKKPQALGVINYIKVMKNKQQKPTLSKKINIVNRHDKALDLNSRDTSRTASFIVDRNKLQQYIVNESMFDDVIRQYDVEIEYSFKNNKLLISGKSTFKIEKAKKYLLNKTGKKELYIEKKEYKGKIVNVVEFGCFVEMPNGFDELLHKSKMTEEQVTDINVGKNLSVIVLSQDNNKIELATKEFLFDLAMGKIKAENSAFDAKNEILDIISEEKEKVIECTIGNKCTGKITNITEFGIFVKLPNKKDGLIHISRFNGNKNSLINTYKIYDEIDVVVISIEENKIHLVTQEYYDSSTTIKELAYETGITVDNLLNIANELNLNVKNSNSIISYDNAILLSESYMDSLNKEENIQVEDLYGVGDIFHARVKDIHDYYLEVVLPDEKIIGIVNEFNFYPYDITLGEVYYIGDKINVEITKIIDNKVYLKQEFDFSEYDYFSDQVIRVGDKLVGKIKEMFHDNFKVELLYTKIIGIVNEFNFHVSQIPLEQIYYVEQDIDIEVIKIANNNIYLKSEIDINNPFQYEDDEFQYEDDDEFLYNGKLIGDIDRSYR